MENKKRCIDNLGGFSPPQRIGMYDCHGEGGSQVKRQLIQDNVLTFSRLTFHVIVSPFKSQTRKIVSPGMALLKRSDTIPCSIGS